MDGYMPVTMHAWSHSFFKAGNNLLRIFLTTLMLLGSVLTYADEIKGQVVGVSDGDTITVLDNNKTQHKIRLVGIDSPEKTQPFGQAAKKSLSDLIIYKQVTIIWNKRDRYQRVLGKVIMEEQDICLEQVKRGMAWHYKQYQQDQPPDDQLKYSQAEKDAREKRIGLWSDDSPVEPSKFRRSK
jgi:endonuclease YncB( thermonuclease family)